MAKVWILHEYEFPDIDDIIGVYSTPQNAEAVRAERDNYRDVVVEYDLDDNLDWRRRPVYEVWVAGETVLDTSVKQVWEAPAHRSNVFSGWAFGQVCSVGVSPVSMEHAKELALAAERQKAEKAPRADGNRG